MMIFCSRNSEKRLGKPLRGTLWVFILESEGERIGCISGMYTTALSHSRAAFLQRRGAELMDNEELQVGA